MEEDKKCTLSGKPADGVTIGAPQPIDPATGMHKDYYVICPDDRAKGFVRPVRHSYKHVGLPAPKYPLRDLTPEEKERNAAFGYVKFEPYPESESPIVGTFWTQDRLDRVERGCGVVTRMSQAIAETYARDPHFYGSTFCCGCGKHLPVGVMGEFIWIDDGERVGT